MIFKHQRVVGNHNCSSTRSILNLNVTVTAGSFLSGCRYIYIIGSLDYLTYAGGKSDFKPLNVFKINEFMIYH